MERPIRIMFVCTGNSTRSQMAEASEMDYLITVCGNAEERCPVLPARVMRIHWPLEDPAAATGCLEHVLGVFRRTRDEIEARVLSFLARLGEPCP